MDCRLKERMAELSRQLREEFPEEFANANTLDELEALACRMGDELARGACQGELRERGETWRGRPADCPDCGERCSGPKELEEKELDGLRGKLAYPQPRYYCRRCRRHFFPDGGPVGLGGAGDGDAEGGTDDGVGGIEHEQLRDGEAGVG